MSRVRESRPPQILESVPPVADNRKSTINKARRSEHTYILEAQVTTTAPSVTKIKITHFLKFEKFLGSHLSSGPSKSTIIILSLATDSSLGISVVEDIFALVENAP